MNLRQLAYFLKIAELRSFTSAANALYVSQPALSKQMRQLEEELGTALFIRSDRGIKLTDAGELLKRRSPAILSDITHLRNELQSVFGQEPSGSLAVGMGMSLQDLLTIPIIAEFQSRHKKVSLHVREGITGTLVEDVKLGLLDCAVVFELAPDEQLVAEPYLRESLLLVGPPDARLTMDKPTSAQEALARPLATTGEDSPLRQKTAETARALKLDLQIAFETNAVSVMIGCISTSSYFAVLPYSAVSSGLKANRVSAAPIVDMSLDWTFVYGRNFGLSLPASKFRSLLFETAANLTKQGQWQFCTMLT
jgi:LysR family transcriptional regulator, nitrogen assimilation regulatory protein